MNFRKFLENEEKNDVLNTLSKIPQSHSALVQGFNWKFHPGNTLNGDNKHVGYMDDHEREIAVAAPWNYGREFTILHEIAHKVWEKLPPELQKAWVQLVSSTHRPREEQQQEPEEMFAMAYATAYVKHPPITYAFPKWIEFIKSLPSN